MYLASIAASMRPPQFAGESLRSTCASSFAGTGFNEAPAVRGGKLTQFEKALEDNNLLQ